MTCRCSRGDTALILRAPDALGMNIGAVVQVLGVAYETFRPSARLMWECRPLSPTTTYGLVNGVPTRASEFQDGVLVLEDGTLWPLTANGWRCVLWQERAVVWTHPFHPPISRPLIIPRNRRTT